MLVRFAALVATAVLTLASCTEPMPSESNIVSVRLHGDGKLGQACEAQSECGFQQRCAYRGKDMGSKNLVADRGVCEASTWPGGCFGLLPALRFSEAERAKMKRDGRDGLPIHVICE